MPTVSERHWGWKMARCRYYKMCWLRLGYDRCEWNADCRRGGDPKCRYYEDMPRKLRVAIEKDKED